MDKVKETLNKVPLRSPDTLFWLSPLQFSPVCLQMPVMV